MITCAGADGASVQTILHKYLTTVSVDGSSCGRHQQGWWDDQKGQGCHHQGHQTEKSGEFNSKVI